jgi:hypothetical protein
MKPTREYRPICVTINFYQGWGWRLRNKGRGSHSWKVINFILRINYVGVPTSGPSIFYEILAYYGGKIKYIHGRYKIEVIKIKITVVLKVPIISTN